MGVTKAEDVVKAREKNKDRLFLQLSCYRSPGNPHQQCRVLTKALRDVKDPSNWNLRVVAFAFGDEGAQKVPNDLSELLQTVATMFPSVSSVQFVTWIFRENAGSALFHSKVVTGYLQQAGPRTHLKKLDFFNSGIFGTKAELQQFYDALRGLRNLETCALEGRFTIVLGTDYDCMRTVYDYTPLFDSISKLPALKAVALPGFVRDETSKSADFGPILVKPGVRSVQLCRLDPADGTAMATIANALADPQVTIRDLKINLSWAREGCYFVERGKITAPHWSNICRLAGE